MKKLLLLGGSRYLIPVIEAAHKMGLYVITCDYFPDNSAHAFSDEYCNVSVIEKDLVLEYAKKSDIVGIMSFACDPGVVTAAYVAEELNLPFQCSYKSAKIFQDKGLFRQFLTDNEFNAPRAKSYTSRDNPLADVDYFSWPVIVKPTDAAGSKGVTRVDNPAQLGEAIATALASSHSDTYIIEDFLTFRGYHSSADVFTVQGELKFVTFSDQMFDLKADNPYTPSAIIWPTSMENQYQQSLSSEIQRLMKLLQTRTGIYNIETCVGIDGTPYIMELSPRGGGCKIAELQKMAFGVDLIENEVRKAVGLPLTDLTQTLCDGNWCEMVVHAQPGQSGNLKALTISQDIKEKYIRLIDLPVEKGDPVEPFCGANMALGDIFLRFDSREELNNVMSKSRDWLKIELE